MSTKRFNNILNKTIIILVILIIGFYTKNNLTKEEKEENKVNNNSTLEVYYFNVGQADSILIKEEDNAMLIDGGNKLDGENIINYLKDELKINEIDILIGTHPHEDHIGGLPEIINSLEIKKLYLPNVTTTSKIFEELLDSIEKNNLKITIPKIDEEISLGNMNFKVLYTGTDEEDLNNSSIILKLNYGNTSFLFTGDATEVTEEKILNKDIKVDVLKIGHHGSNYSTSKEFLEKTNPDYIVISVGENNSYGHPGKKTLKKIKNIETYRTDIDGTIKITSDKENIDIEKLSINLNG